MCESVKNITFAAVNFKLSSLPIMNHLAPLDINRPVLPERLIEQVARNVHDQWVQERRRQGWTWGEHRDDDKKEHPGIAPYDSLTDDEKEIDRVTVRAVISSLLSVGATITLNDRKDDI